MTIELNFFGNVNHPVDLPTRLSKRPLSSLKAMMNEEKKNVPNQIGHRVIVRRRMPVVRQNSPTFNALLTMKPLSWLRFAFCCLLFPMLGCGRWPARRSKALVSH